MKYGETVYRLYTVLFYGFCVAKKIQDYFLKLGLKVQTKCK